MPGPRRSAGALFSSLASLMTVTQPFPTISRTQLSYVRDVVTHKRTRDRDAVFALEGLKPILELLRSNPEMVSSLLVTPIAWERQPSALQQELTASGRSLYDCPEERLAQVSDVETCGGWLAVVRRPMWDQSAVLAQPTWLGLYGDQLQDPANLGTIIRTAAGLQVSALWLAPNSVDVFNPKIVRATAGTLFRLPIFFQTTPAMLSAFDCEVVAATSDRADALSIRAVQTRAARTMVAIGSESRGLSPAVLEIAARRVTIPLRDEVESLNAAAAAAIVLFHLSGLPVVDHPRR